MRRAAYPLFAIALLLAGCVTRDVQLSRGDVKPVARQRVAVVGDCRLPKFVLVDARDYPGLGWIGGHELLYPELQPWLDAALDDAAAIDADAAPLRVEISRAYIESHPSGHSFQLVLSVRGASEDEPARVYRGSDSGITWWGTKSEFGRYVKSAGNKAIAALVRGEARCGRR